MPKNHTLEKNEARIKTQICLTLKLNSAHHTQLMVHFYQHWSLKLNTKVSIVYSRCPFHF